MWWVWDVTESEDGEEEHYQLPSHAAVSEDQGTDQAGQVKGDKMMEIGRHGGSTEVICSR